MKQVSVSMIGSGFAARLHGNAFRLVSRLEVRLRACCDLREDTAKVLAEEYGYEVCTTDYRQILQDPETDVVFVCTPPRFHAGMAAEALRAGKHVVCEKPLTGYFGPPGSQELIGRTVPKREMFRSVLAELERLEAVVKESGRQFMYAENYVYTPCIQRAAEFLRAKGSTITYMRGEETVQGSPTAGAGLWRNIGGGSLLRIGCHPLGGILYLKSVEAAVKGHPVSVESIVADTGMLSVGIPEAGKRHLRARPQDVEDFGMATLTFSDSTKATIFANDNVLGGVRNYVEVYTNDSTLMCRITPNDALETYFPDPLGLDGVYMSEKLEEKTGWNRPFVAESFTRGYVGQLQDFLECAAENRRPLSGFPLARQVAETLYAAYISAEEGRRVFLSEWKRDT